MPRPQFSLKTLLWSMALVAAFLGGMGLQRQLDVPVSRGTDHGSRFRVESIELHDGAQWFRVFDDKSSSEDGYLWWDGENKELRPMIDGGA